MPKKQSKEDFIKKARIIHGDKFNYDGSIYINVRTKMDIVCNDCGYILNQSPRQHYHYGCAKCAGKTKHTLEDFIGKATSIHGDYYDYSLVEYKNSRTKVKIICPTHGIFEQSPNNHIAQQQGCGKCGRDKKAYTQQQVIDKAVKAHSGFYDYSLVDYKNFSTPVKILCPIHGVFMQDPYAHITKKCGCQKCASVAKSHKDTFIEKAKNTHGDYYDYSLIEYKNNYTKVKIICPKHGIFNQRPKAHTKGAGCEKCISPSSSPENAWLDSLNIPQEHRQYRIDFEDGTYIKADGYDPDTNTVYEFHGDYWHGNPNRFNPEDKNPTNGKTFGELYENTLRREEKIRNAGYNLVVKWES